MPIRAQLRRRIVADFERTVGRHDDPGTYGGAPGDPGLIGPDSVSWTIHADLASVAIAGIPAIVLELLHPSVVAGVQDQSRYREDPFRRARSTLGYVLTTTFGNTEAATRTIERVKRVHARINGERLDGTPYRALDPELLAWVHTSIPWMIMRAFERYHRPLTPGERDRYLAEQAIIGRMAGADPVPASMEELAEFVEAMRPSLVVNEQTLEFFDFLMSSPFVPKVPAAAERAVHLLLVHSGMTLAPPWARELTGFTQPALVRRAVLDPYLNLDARLVRWAFGTPPYAALARARARTDVSAPAGVAAAA
jgi:uncharacterized protein (DUF2236 family)